VTVVTGSPIPVILLGKSSFSQCEIFEGSVEMMTSSKPRRLIASSTARADDSLDWRPAGGVAQRGHGALDHACGLAGALILGVDDLVQTGCGVRHEQRERRLTALRSLAHGVEQRLRRGRLVGDDEHPRGNLGRRLHLGLLFR